MGYGYDAYGSSYADAYGSDSYGYGAYGGDGSSDGAGYGGSGGYFDYVGGGRYLNDPAFYDPGFYMYVPGGYGPGYYAPLDPSTDVIGGDAGYYGYGGSSGPYGAC